MNWSTNFTMLFPGPLRIDFGNKSKSVVDSIDESTKLLNTFTYDDDTSMFENNNYAKDDMVTISRSDIDAETLGEICRNEGPYDQYLRLTRLENVALLTSYFSVGFALTFLSTPLNYYMITSLDASSADIGVLATVQSLPWSFKVFYGLLSDTVPIFDYRRKPYLIIGWTLYVFTNFSLAACQTPGIVSSITGSFLMTVALLLAEVATDTLCVERAKLETIHMKGNLQVTGFTYRAFGRILGEKSDYLHTCFTCNDRMISFALVLGASLGSVVYNQGDWGWGLSIGQIFMVNGVIPAALVLTAIVPLVELASDRPLPTFREQLQVSFVVLSDYIWRLYLESITQKLHCINSVFIVGHLVYTTIKVFTWSYVNLFTNDKPLICLYTLHIGRCGVRIYLFTYTTSCKFQIVPGTVF